jgi:hypothetical protein
MNIDLEFTKWLATLGIGGVLAAFMFTFYRKDVKQYTELWKTNTDQLLTVIKDNTGSNMKLISMLENLERNAIRKEDISNMIDKKLNERELP